MALTPYVFVCGYADANGDPTNVLFQPIDKDTLLDASMIESFLKRHDFAFMEVYNLREDELQYYFIDERVTLTANQLELMKAK